MKKIIEEYANAKGIIFGICNADNLSGLNEDIINIPFFKGNFYDRVSPRIFLHGAKSIIVLGVKVCRDPIFENLDYIMAPSLSGIDYHKRLDAIAKELISKMLEYTKFNFRIQIDSGPLIERAFALKAGFGFIGKNNFVINHEFGSFFNIALIVTDMEIDATPPSAQLSCENCEELCIKYCPSKALSHDNKFDYSKCISYLTQKKEALSECEMALIGISIYGCDICQNICPHNSHNIIPPSQRNLSERVLRNILSMDSKQFEEKFKNSNLFWRGEKTIRRNCGIAIDNLKGYTMKI